MEQLLPGSFWKEHGPANTLVSVQGTAFGLLEVQGNKSVGFESHSIGDNL